ncbi:hypothetical protein SAMN02910369_01220 [Lachnospiraceae bacterium NE2001]|nr:hypothetical protein SAMN02910369_01220 [Lachnospiraceae bacterium NE2001]
MKKIVTVVLVAALLSFGIKCGNVKDVFAQSRVNEMGGDVVVDVGGGDGGGDSGAADSGDGGGDSSGGSASSSGYSQEQIAAAKAWLSAHGYAPTRAGANQAYQDYLAGKLDNDPDVRKYKGLDSNTSTSSNDTTSDTETGENGTKDDKSSSEEADGSDDKTEDKSADDSNDAADGTDKNSKNGSSSKTDNGVDVAFDDLSNIVDDEDDVAKADIESDAASQLAEEIASNDDLELSERNDDAVYLVNEEPAEEESEPNFTLYLLITAVILMVGASAFLLLKSRKD